MNHFTRATARMEALAAACDELITMARKDIAELELRRKNALMLIDAWKKIKAPSPPWEEEVSLHLEWSPEELEHARKTHAAIQKLYNTFTQQAKEIADHEPQSVGCMGVGMKY